ncbi:imidazole glycerol phosphate synthase subunit HisH [Chryseobacterium sp. MYb264]|uniref:imidazole glycerol phosphate synthase subunit HisH n=1 Tax=Chryseobacterium sp. MYb264 TaxID=2745153 RepID=UPI002E13995A|nr:imidazole glycerol phosphate synthase subunit HisH [Chryseobacterium sp. MYb264]
MSKKVVIIDYNLGNLFSVYQALVNIGLDVVISSDPSEIAIADAIVLPGVGAFKEAKDNLDKMGLTDELRKAVIENKKPFLGICLGLQLLFTSSEEFGTTEGLDFVKGKVLKFSKQTEDHKIRIPQISWNTIHENNPDVWKSSPLKDTKSGADMYFVHSFYIVPENESITLTYTEYAGIRYTSSILIDNIFACQFHPEKSAKEGLKIYKIWAEQNNLY